MKIISVTGHKKSGKTALVERLVQELGELGKVGTVKHLHDHDLNPPGTDTRRHMDSGAALVLGITPSGTAAFTSSSSLEQALDELADHGMDYAVVEGFKDSDLPKIVLGDLELSQMVRRSTAGPADLSDEAIDDFINCIQQQPEYHTLGSLEAKVRLNPLIQRAGTIGSFTGIVRERTGEIKTEGLDFECYEQAAGSKIQQIEQDLRGREGIVDVRIHHRTGWIGPGQDIVYIVVAASHRQQLFPVLSEAIERVKAEVPIWKKEHTTGGEYWVHDHP